MTERRFEALLARKHLPGLDGLRAIAVAVVMVFHAQTSRILTTTGFARFFSGGLGVTLFFVLSGFLITHLLLREHQHSGTISLHSFYLRRTLRIWPAYYVFLVVALILQKWPGGAGLSAALFYHNYYLSADWPARASSLTHTWSLSVEEQFYLAWPLLCLLLFRRSRRTALVAVTTLVVGVGVWRSIGYLALQLGWHHAAFATDSRFDSLAIGGLLGIACTSPRFCQLAARSARWAWVPLLVVAGIYWLDTQPDDFTATAGFTVIPLLMALLIVQLMQLSTRRWWSWLEHPITRYIGRISYPLYLYHPLAQNLSWRLRDAGVRIWGPRQFLVSVMIAIGLASVSYYVIEGPFLALKRRLSPSAAEGRAVLRHAA